jgi:mannosyltransferase
MSTRKARGKSRGVRVAAPERRDTTRSGRPAEPAASDRHRQTDRRSLLERAAPWLLTAAALALRLFRLDREPLWFDEAYTALAVVKPVGEIFALLHGEGNAPLYYLVLHAWTGLFGDSPFALRLVSALFATAAIPVLYWVGTQMFSRRAGLIAAGLATVSPLQIHYAQEARMYGMMPLFALVVVFAFDRLFTAPSWRSAAGLAAAAMAGLYLHYYTLFILPLGALAFLAPEPRRTVAYTAAALVLAVVGFLPWVPILLHQQSGYSYEWVPAWWKTRSLALAFPWSLQTLGPGASYPTWATFKFGSATWAGAVSSALSLAVLGGAVWQLRAVKRRLDLPLLLALAGTVVPLLIAVGYSSVQRPVYVVGRHDLIAWGAYHLLAGAVLARLAPPVSLSVIAVWIALAAYTLAPYLTSTRPKRNYADMGDVVARRIVAAAEPGDLVVFTAASRTMTQYYLREATDLPRLVSYPLENDQHLGWTDPRIRDDPAFAEAETRRFVAWLKDSGPLPSVVWLVGPGSRGNPPLLRELAVLGYSQDPTASSQAILKLRRE